MCASSSHATRGNIDVTLNVAYAGPVAVRTLIGFVFPTRRLVHLHDASGVANQRFSPITIDVAALTVDQASLPMSDLLLEKAARRTRNWREINV